MKKKSRAPARILTEMVRQRILPELGAMGFAENQESKNAVPMWHLHRAKGEGSFDLISVILDDKRRPDFYAVINKVGPAGLAQPWGQQIMAPDVTALDFSCRIFMMKKRVGVTAFLLPRWFSHRWFGFTPQFDEQRNRIGAERECRHFIKCLEQAEQWWKNGVVGPNLLSGEIRVIGRMPSGKSS